MVTVTQALRDEHKELADRIENLRRVGDAINETTLSDSVRDSIDQVYKMLTQYILPHSKAEDKVLYPMVQKAMGSVHATATMSREHVEMGSLTRELGALKSQITGATISKEQLNSLHRILYGLYVMMKLHVVKEEEIYLPLLDSHLQPEDAVEMFESIEAAAREEKVHHHHAH